jgi:hypothetical protein
MREKRHTLLAVIAALLWCPLIALFHSTALSIYKRFTGFISARDCLLSANDMPQKDNCQAQKQ